MAPRANWKGTLRVAEVTCPVALYTAASTADRIAFHTINRATGNRIRREFLDAETGRAVPREDQVKSYELDDGRRVILSPEEVVAAVPDSDKVLAVEAFLNCADIDDVYFDRPYYLTPASHSADEAFSLILRGLHECNMAALARTVLFRRVRSVLIRPQGRMLVATTLNFDYEVRPARLAFADLPDKKIDAEMLDLARHIISTKMGKFDPAAFHDRYETALQDLVRARMEGREIAPRPPQPRDAVVNLMEALRESARRSTVDAPGGGKAEGRGTATRKTGRKTQSPRRKAG